LRVYLTDATGNTLAQVGRRAAGQVEGRGGAVGAVGAVGDGSEEDGTSHRHTNPDVSADGTSPLSIVANFASQGSLRRLARPSRVVVPSLCNTARRRHDVPL